MRQRSSGIVGDFDDTAAAACLADLFPAQNDNKVNPQKIAAATALLKRFCVLSGGPGTGKTATVIRIAALLATVYQDRKPRIALVAPTGKAATRLEESVAAHLPRLGCPPSVAAFIPRTASTIHGLLQPLPDSPYFRHDAGNPLAFDAVIVDEASMVDLALMVKLLEAVPPDSRVVLIGDRNQLASVEAGALLGDICGQAETDRSSEMCTALKRLAPEFSDRAMQNTPVIADTIVTLNTNYRFGAASGIGRVSRAVIEGDAEETAAILVDGSCTDCSWWAPENHAALRNRLEGLVTSHVQELLSAAGPTAALLRLNGFRILCAVRHGPLGVEGVNRTVEAVLAKKGLIFPQGNYYGGQPVIVTRNDYSMGLYNGDTGIILADEEDSGTLKAFFPDGPDWARAVPLSRLPPHETAWALTVHKAQGSEFDRVVLVLPSSPSPLVTRELLYTGITRARKECEIWSNEEVLRAAVQAKIKRTSGLAEALWAGR